MECSENRVLGRDTADTHQDVLEALNDEAGNVGSDLEN
jgi:hypothetical protein